MSEKLTLSLMENACDFIMTAADFAKKNDHKAWKHALLNLASGLELLLKARLEQEHWSLLFSNVDKASKLKLQQGDFVSVDFSTTLNRLKCISNLNLTNIEEQDLESIRKIRNRVIHSSIDISLSELRGLAARGINIFIDFYKENFRSDKKFISKLSKTLLVFEEFVNSRLKALKSKLDESDRPPTACRRKCKYCLQDTLVINDGIIKCLYCEHEISLKEFAEDVSEGYIGLCPECETESLAFILYNNEDGDWICINCGFKSEYNYTRECVRCGEQFWDEEELVCSDCRKTVLEVE